MPDQKKLFSIENHEENLLFYKVMRYPLPIHFEYFLFEKKTTEGNEGAPLYSGVQDHKNGIKNPEQAFSRYQKNPYMESYVKYINKFGRLYKSIPFVQSIYLCNSLSFNALHENSDIDLFIVCKKNKLWRARLFSLLFFVLLGLKRSLKRKRKKFCLSFYITEDAANLYNITLPKADIYFAYRLAHLIPLYQEHDTNIYQHNSRLLSLLPNFPQKHIINIGTQLFKGLSKPKRALEYLFGGIFGKIIEKAIKLIWLPIIILKTKKHQEDGRGIIINDKMLKFHMDIRKKVRLAYQLQKKTRSRERNEEKTA